MVYDGIITSGADPGFLEGGFKSTKGGSFPRIYLIFHKFSHEIERICLQLEPPEPPLNPPLNIICIFCIRIYLPQKDSDIGIFLKFNTDSDKFRHNSGV